MNGSCSSSPSLRYLSRCFAFWRLQLPLGRRGTLRGAGLLGRDTKYGEAAVLIGLAVAIITPIVIVHEVHKQHRSRGLRHLRQ